MIPKSELMKVSSETVKPRITRRAFVVGSAAISATAIMNPHFAFASPVCGVGDSNGLPIYWNGWNVITNDPTNLGASTFSKATPPAMVARDANHLDVFVIGNDGNVWTNSWIKGSVNSVWGGWTQIPGGPFSSQTPVAVVAPTASTMNIFAIGNDSRVWTNFWDGSWAGWSVISSDPSNPSIDQVSNLTPPSVISRNSTQLDIFAIGLDGYVWTISWSGAWSPWTQIPGGPFSSQTPVAVVTPTASTMNIFAIGNDSRVWTNFWGGSWAGWSVISSDPSDPSIDQVSNLTPPSVVSRNSTQLDIFAIGLDGYVWTISWNGSWSPWTQIPGGPFSNKTPVVAVALDASNMSIFALGNDNRVWTNAWNSGWCGWNVVSDNPNLAPFDTFSNTAPPMAIRRDATHMELMILGNDSRLYRNTWGQATQVFVPQSTSRICQLTSNYDPAGLTHINDTTAWGIPGTDMGIPVEFNGTLYILYGDVPTFSGDQNADSADPICYTNDTSVGPNGFHLSCVLGSSGSFRPFTITGYGIMGGFETPTGAFSYNGILYAFVIRSIGSSLTGTTNPSTNFTSYYDISGSSGPFWQIAPWVIQNANCPGLPSSTGDGLLMWAQGYTGIYLAWMPLTPGVNPPPLSSIQYYAGPGVWSADESDAVPVTSTIGVTAISVTWLDGPQQWLLMYTRASSDLPHESIVARVGSTPWTWSDEIQLFNPDREGAWGQFMHMPGSDDLYTLPIGMPDSTTGWAYAPFLLNRFTTWNATTRIATIYYSMATFNPYQVQLMTSKIQFG